jgi:nucleotide-binding universal stress UspA family protein
MPTVTRILVPIDFSPSARAALQYAGFLADKLGASVEVLHVFEPPGYVGPDTLALLPITAGHHEWGETKADVERQVEQFLADTSGGPATRTVRVEAGEPSDAILRVAAEDRADLVVMGTHGRTGLSRLLIGSVAEAVLRRASCPVLTLRIQTKAARESIPL